MLLAHSGQGGEEEPPRCCRSIRRKQMSDGKCGGCDAGAIWFAGWLFTLAYAQLGFWQAVLGIVAWPYLLGVAVR
jgi:hypothetical protein